MSSRRTERVSQAVLECVSSTILFELKDPRVQGVTVVGAEVSSDLRFAKVKVSVMGDEKTQALTMRGLNSARGFLQSKVADRLQTRYTPVLRFVLDDGVKLSIQTAEILKELLPDSQTAGDDRTEDRQENDTTVNSTPHDPPDDETSHRQKYQPADE